mmetsp:Transcript_140/g.232  ORF Transcript_140/g.232 Transcript_140/m.232 type:complete len:188 (-) Transcript_140:148-711(-)|eukprot:CAMPEP_0185257124 /NCGR_PEP_ID=MMETSP1359-20130426/6199_1 /TAXON_ID=552665 /ORGANISM="Bigelowiella longifila, Strain CCMP242" /LENGTH=187 /DNA_ID=CAMNT_0027842061 /DNA_START=89 /DNA_END=652 /DNA_ORIENTATION=+
MGRKAPIEKRDAESSVVQRTEVRPEDSIPDRPENQEAREFLKNAPSKGLWLPFGKEVKVMKCWRCKQYGHRTGDRECPMKQMGNMTNEKKRRVMYDPMASMVEKRAKKKEARREARRERQLAKIAWYQELLEEEREKRDRKRNERMLAKAAKKSSKKKRKKKTKVDSSSSDSSSDSSSSSSSSSDDD